MGSSERVFPSKEASGKLTLRRRGCRPGGWPAATSAICPPATLRVAAASPAGEKRAEEETGKTGMLDKREQGRGTRILSLAAVLAAHRGRGTQRRLREEKFRKMQE